MLDLVSYSTTSAGSAKLRPGLPVPPELISAPDWPICFPRGKLPSELGGVDAQLLGLTLSTTGNQAWAKLLREGANNLSCEDIPQLYTICGASHLPMWGPRSGLRAMHIFVHGIYIKVQVHLGWWGTAACS